MGKVYKYPTDNIVAQAFSKTNEAIEDDKYAEILKRFGADVDDDPLPRVSAEDAAEAELLWARAWRGIELQKAIESIARTDGWLRVIYQIPFSTWKAYRSKD